MSGYNVVLSGHRYPARLCFMLAGLVRSCVIAYKSESKSDTLDLDPNCVAGSLHGMQFRPDDVNGRLACFLLLRPCAADRSTRNSAHISQHRTYTAVADEYLSHSLQTPPTLLFEKIAPVFWNLSSHTHKPQRLCPQVCEVHRQQQDSENYSVYLANNKRSSCREASALAPAPAPAA